MIIFDLDALADDSHRRHFIDPSKDPNSWKFSNDDWRLLDKYGSPCIEKKWQPDYESYNAACDGDKLILPVAKVYEDMRFQRGVQQGDFQIWSSQCESTKYKTYEWLHQNKLFFNTLKMRPIGDDSPQEVLFERWLNEMSFTTVYTLKKVQIPTPHNIEMVFSSHKPTIEMFRRRNVFTFDCNQGEA